MSEIKYNKKGNPELHGWMKASKKKLKEFVDSPHKEKALKKAEKSTTDKSDTYKRRMGRDAQLALGARRLKKSRYDEFGREK